MRLRSVSIRGSIGLSLGLGLDQVDLDLSGLRGVVALTGRIGSGKTTFLEMCQPFRFLPSRKIGLKDAMQLRNSHKDLTFEWNGDVVRSLINVDAQGRAEDGYLWVNDQPKSTGKVTEHDEQLERLLGNQDLCFNSIFAAQRVDSLLTMRPGQRKDFFVELLGHAQLQEFAERAKKIAAWVEAHMSGRRQALRNLEEYVATLPHLETQLADRQRRHRELEPTLAQLTVDLEKLETEFRDLEVRHGQQGEIKKAVFAIDQQSKDLTIAQDRQAQKSRAEINDLNERLTAAEGFAGRDRAALAKLREAMIWHRTTADMQTAIGQLEFQVSETEKEIAEQNAIQVQVRDVQLRYTKTLAKLDQQLTQATELASLATKIPENADRSICFGCGFAKAALRGEVEKPTLEKTMASETENRDREVQTLKDRLNGAGLIETRDSLRGKIREFREAITQEQKAEQLETAIGNRDEQAAGYRTRLETLEEDLKATIKDFSEKQLALAGDRKEAAAKLDATLELALVNKRLAVSNARNTHRKFSDELVQLAIQTGELTQSVNRCRESSVALETARANLLAMDRERAEWVLLQQICGRDKLQALELDAASPAITGYMNRLLSSCFGGRFLFDFQTLDPEGREIFDLMVTDTRNGKTDSLLLKSGGQKVLVLQALRFAIALYGKERSNRDFKTLYCDEVDGAIDPETREDFVEMFRSAMRLGGFELALLITHSREVAASADQVLEFAEGGIQLR